MGTPQIPSVDSDTKLFPTSVMGALQGSFDGRYSQEDAAAMAGRGYFVTADSFGTNVFTPPYVDLIAADRAMSEANTSVGGSFFQDGANRAIGTGGTINPNVPSDAFVHIAYGINPAYFAGNIALTRAAEKASLEAMIWLAASTSRLADSNWTTTGSWSTYTGGGSESMSGGSSRVTSDSTAYAEITPGAGDWVALGYNFSASLGQVSGTGQYAKNGVTVAPNMTDSPLATHNGSAIVTRPIRFLGLAANDVIRASWSNQASGFMFVDDVIKLGANPPWIIIVKPTYSRQTSFPVPNATVDLYRSDIDSVIASVTAAYKPLRGKIIVVDPVTNGWDATVHTGSDGLHPSAAGALFLSKLVQRQVAYAVRLRQQLLASGLI